MKELKLCVEKAVRPVWAMNRRKDGMRQELYFPLREVFEKNLQFWAIGTQPLKQPFGGSASRRN